MHLNYTIAALCILGFFVLRNLLHRSRLRFVTQLPGPPPGSFLAGNLPSLAVTKNVGETEFEWMSKYGAAMHIKGALGRDLLFTADPKALQYVMNTSGYKFPKSPDFRYLIRMVAGKGIVWADGEQHARHKRIMTPAFSVSAIKSYVPMFQENAKHLVAKLRDMVSQSYTTSSVIDITSWLARLTLDIMGSAFDYDLGALSQTDNELAKVYKNLFLAAYSHRTDAAFAAQEIFGYLPDWTISVLQSIPDENLAKVRNYKRVALRTAKMLVDREVEALAAGNEGGENLMSHLVKANVSLTGQDKLGMDELLGQLTTLLLAGHETTAGTVTWTLYELSTRPHLQAKIREEIKEARRQAGRQELGPSDYESMPYLVATLKASHFIGSETLRFHPLLPTIIRMAENDDVIPLLTPQITKTGETVKEIPVSKGQRIMISIAAYNRLESVWGKDSHEWKPERFLNNQPDNEKAGLGVYANLATFSSGERSCMGLIEMHLILAELLENFAFSPPPGNVEILRVAASLMVPTVKGSDTGRVELPLTITPVL
ncbi:PAH-inducible cytochrome P450 monooxygenase PC-PAH 1 [Ramaria rubella]|nr:PAH-inducible cytochrome P450 monooxygenase PC-PAH 1 [Ramaria rubella]